jgi:hypothetical protein
MFSATIRPRKVSIRVRERTIRHLLLLYFPNLRSKSFSKMPLPRKKLPQKGEHQFRGKDTTKGKIYLPWNLLGRTKKNFCFYKLLQLQRTSRPRPGDRGETLSQSQGYIHSGTVIGAPVLYRKIPQSSEHSFEKLR